MQRILRPKFYDENGVLQKAGTLEEVNEAQGKIQEASDKVLQVEELWDELWNGSVEGINNTLSQDLIKLFQRG